MAGIPEYISIISNTKHFVKFSQKGRVGYEPKDRNLEFLNQPDFYIPFTAKIHLPKPNWKNLVPHIMWDFDVRLI